MRQCACRAPCIVHCGIASDDAGITNQQWKLFSTVSAFRGECRQSSAPVADTRIAFVCVPVYRCVPINLIRYLLLASLFDWTIYIREMARLPRCRHHLNALLFDLLLLFSSVKFCLWANFYCTFIFTDNVRRLDAAWKLEKARNGI